jgi:hypothetical protein
MKRLLLLAVLVAGAVAPAAGAGGWATVQLSEVPTDGTTAGTTLPIDITVLQHGQTPLDGVTPIFRIRDGESNVREEYRGTPTGDPGVYHVDVTFPEAGLFTFEVYDGFAQYGGAQTHTYPVVEIAPPAGEAFPWPAVVGGGLLAAALAALVIFLLRRSRAVPQAAPQA